MYFCTQRVQYNGYSFSTVSNFDLAHQHQGISSHGTDYAPMHIQMFMGKYHYGIRYLFWRMCVWDYLPQTTVNYRLRRRKVNAYASANTSAWTTWPATSKYALMPSKGHWYRLHVPPWITCFYAPSLTRMSLQVVLSMGLLFTGLQSPGTEKWHWLI